MLNLKANDSIYIQTTGGTVAYQLRFDNIPFKQGVVPTGRSNVHTATLSSESLNSVSIWNTGNATDVSLFFGGTAIQHRTYNFTLAEGEFAVVKEDLKVYDSDGVLKVNDFAHITVSSVPPSSPSMGDLWVNIA